MLFKQLVVTLLLTLGAHAAASKAQTYIVTLKPSVNIQSHITERRVGFELKYVYSAALNGYAAALSPESLKALKTSEDVAKIELQVLIIAKGRVIVEYMRQYSDQIFSVSNEAVKPTSQLVQRARAQMEKRAAGGAGVDIYFLDTGIQTTQACFGGRAIWGATFGGYADADGSGHGTAMAASALCGGTGGTATSATGIAVKVLSDSGSGTTSGIIAGVNWVASQVQSRGRPGIVALALGGSSSAALSNAVAGVVKNGTHVVVTAGFSAADVSTVSPANVEGAVTVGSLPRTKAFPSNSNRGAGLDVWSFYPISCPTGITGCTTPTNAVSYVAGYLAVAIGSYGNKSPAALSADLKAHAVADVTGAPSGTTNLRAVPW